MSPDKYIYEVIDKTRCDDLGLELHKTLNEENTNIPLHHIIETDDFFIVIWID